MIGARRMLALPFAYTKVVKNKYKNVAKNKKTNQSSSLYIGADERT